MGRTSRLPLFASCFIAFALTDLSLAAGTKGRGHLGPPLATSTGITTEVSTSFNPTFSVTPASGETTTSVVSRLITAVNADANFSATMIGVGTGTFEVSYVGSANIAHILVTETDPGITEAGVSIDAPGRTWVAISRVTSVNGNGNYRLIIDMATGPDYDQTFNTTVSPNNTAAGLNASLQSSFAAAGFCSLVDSGTGLLYIQKPGFKFLSATQSATDSAITSFTLDITDTAPATPGSCTPIAGGPAAPSNAVPTLSEFGMFVLVALLTGAALLVLRRKGAHHAG